MEDGSDKSEELLEDDGGDHDIDSEQVFAIGNNDVETESLFGIEGDDLENGSELVLDIESHEQENDSEQILEFENNDLEDKDQMIEFRSNNHNTDGAQMLEIGNNNQDDASISDDQQDPSESKHNPPPVVGMEFESYEDAYKYYNCYAKELGFAIRVKSSWTKRNSKEKRGAVLCCNCEGFKTLKEASSRRKETRTGCLAMIRLRLVESSRWRVDEVKLEHNHLFDPERAQNSKSHKRTDSGVKRKLEPTVDVEVRTIKLYRTPIVDAICYGSSNERDFDNEFGKSKRLNLNKGDAQVIHDYFCRVQLINPNFFYIMDFTDDGYVRNVFWIDSRARASYGYFGDVVSLDTTCLTSKYIVPLVVFVGVNHHGQTISLGCALLADESQETYTWLLRAWLTCMWGRPPQTIITDPSMTLQSAIAEIFPRAHHRLCLPLVVERILESLANLESEVLPTVLNSIIYNSIKVEEFEVAWDDMIQRFAIRDNEYLRKLFEDRERWAPVYSKDTYFAGMFTFQPGESTVPFFHGYVHQQTSLKEFFEMHDLVLQNKIQKEAFDDCESRDSNPKLRTICTYESQLSKVYTKQIFSLFQYEVEMMSNCFNISQVNTSGLIVTYMITEQETEGNSIRNLEVMFDKIGLEIRCICSCFNFKGYLCRHALSVLNHNGIDEIPSQYILSRWRKDFKRLYVPDLGSDNVDVSSPVQWFVHLHKQALQVVEEGMTSQEHYMVAWQAFKESLNKVRLVSDKQAQS
ncbi:protein FAR1-RELATED SEQUENCE 8-like [Cynara cardunculus var. scolymus]|uniref:protein FAR1-RELATED SEQUENCE 8-like n=1 Tax=Cynara cardunculus var. scolymus TaxID=59895 RepID=UPI000D6265D1|nr:protein FAR1-RELATED SEQUENCE 8-like [Cynara cardunculus var. scolymus]